MRRRNNIMPREMEKSAIAAGWEHARTTGSHVIYKKKGFRKLLPIPRHSKALKGRLALRLLRTIEESLEVNGKEE